MRQAGARRGASTVTWVCTLCRSTRCACIRIRRQPTRTSLPCSALRRVLCTRTTLGTQTRPRRAAGVRMSRTCWTAQGTTSSACSNCNDKTLRHSDVSCSYSAGLEFNIFIICRPRTFVYWKNCQLHISKIKSGHLLPTLNYIPNKL